MWSILTWATHDYTLLNDEQYCKLNSIWMKTLNDPTCNLNWIQILIDFNLNSI